MLEAHLHQCAYFVTLTYSDENLPKDGSVSGVEAQLFLKRLRSRVSPMPVRYFIVGEYGDVSLRPHYHAVLFGDFPEESVRASWTLGHVHVGTVTPQSCGYVVSYVLKGATRQGPAGRAPEFARMSLKPGLGAKAMEVIGKVVLDEETGEIRFGTAGDVPSVVRSGGKVWPLGRYLRGRLRRECHLGPGEPEVVRHERQRKLQEALLVPGARELLEGKRRQSARIAKARLSISRSKKGLS